MKKYYYIAIILALTGCDLAPFSPEYDLQGNNPYEYYAEHPIKNKVETRQMSALVHFMTGQAKLSDEEEHALRSELHTISPPAVDAMVVRLSRNDQFDSARQKSLSKLLAQIGYKKIQFEHSSDIKRGTASVDVTYLAVVAPDCPDWRMSPVTSYSNTWQGNSKCAEEVNLGLMVADPHDLVHGTGDTGIMSMQRDTKAVQDYNEGKDFMPNTLNAGNTGSSSGSGGSSSSGSSGSSGLPGGATSAVTSGMPSAGGSQ